MSQGEISHRNLVGLQEGEAGLLGGTSKVSSVKLLGLEVSQPDWWLRGER